jgi:hypothetical protein
MRRRLYRSSWFQSYRLMLNLLYLDLGRLGLRPVERYMLCHVIANGVEEMVGSSAADLMEASWLRRVALLAQRRRFRA